MAKKTAPKTTGKIGGFLAALLALLVGVGFVSPDTRDWLLSWLGGSPSSQQTGPTSTPVDASKLPKTPNSFDSAKRILYEKIYAGHSKTFYCGCDFDPKQRTVDLASCGVTPRKNAERASRVEAEHVFPAEWFGGFRPCWRDSEKVCGLDSKGEKIPGRKCCEKDPVFMTAHNDLHNLYPAVGEVNGDRSNFSWGMIPGNKQEYGRCAIKIDSSIRRAEPPDAVKGDISRTMFYMSATYGFRLSRQDVQLFNAWDKQDPVDAWEQERNRRIAAVQGNLNPFITEDSKQLDSSHVSDAPAGAVTPTAVAVTPAPAPVYRCEPKKTCGQMASCEEARYHLTQCGNTGLDRDGDGTPCASLCGG